MAAVNAASHIPHSRPDIQIPSASSASTMSSHIATPLQAAFPHGEVPTAPGMMDIEMEDAPPHNATSAFAKTQHPRTAAVMRPSGVSISAPASPWAGAFRPQGGNTPPHCLPPSLLSSGMPHTASSTPTPEQQLKALKKAQRKAERMAARGRSICEVTQRERKSSLVRLKDAARCNKQANGLKYHLTKSVNGHGHVNLAAMGGIAPFLSERGSNGG